MLQLKQVLNVAAKIFAGLLTFYLVAGYFIFPAVIKGFVNGKVSAMLNHFVYVDKITFNPILFRLNIYGLDVAENEGTRLIGVDRLYLDFSFLSLLKQKYRIESLEITGLYVHPIFSKNGDLNFLNLIPPSSSVDNERVKEEATAKAPPVIMLDHFKLNNSVVHVEDKTIERPFNYAFRPINLQIEGLSTAINVSSDVAIVIYISQEGKVVLKGNLQVQPLQLTMTIDVEQVALKSFQPYVQNFSDLSIRNGNLNLKGIVVYDGLRTSGESLSFKGEMNCQQFQLRDSMTKEPLLSWEILEIKAIKFLLDDKILNLDQVLFDQLQGRFVLEADGLNVIRVTEAKQSKKEDSEKKEISRPEEKLENDVTAIEGNFQFNLGELIFHNSVLTFIDQTTEPNFKTVMKNIEINIKGISTQPESEVHLTGNGLINEQGSLSVNANTFPFVQPVDLDLVFQLKDLNMIPFAPYVGKFTGLGVKEGNLNLDIDYEISSDELVAEHGLVIDKFNFGQKVESEDALKLPFRMATALLKDARGDIKIDLPVKGNISDPKFKYAHLLGQTFTNFILKVVTKPFTFLASVIGSEGGEEEFSYINFMPGTSILADSEQEKIIKVSQALRERPSLDIEIRGGFDPQADWLAIKTESFRKEYELRLNESTRSMEKVLEEYYKKIFGLPIYRALVKDFKSQNDGQYQKEEFYVELKRQLIENAPADKTALEVLANNRAETIRHLFVDRGGLDAARVSVKVPSEVEANTIGMIALELTLIIKE